MLPRRMVVLPHTTEIMKEIQKKCPNMAPLDLFNSKGVVLQNEFVLCVWEFTLTLHQSEKVEVVRNCPPVSTRGIVSVFEQLLIEQLADHKDGEFLVFNRGVKKGPLRIRAHVCPIEFEMRMDAMRIEEEDYLAWRAHLEEFYWAIRKIPCFKKSKPVTDN